MKNNIKVYFFTIIIIIFIGLCGNWLIESYGPSFLLISSSKLPVLTTEIWQVQALLTTIVVAINALSLGFLNKKVYGYNILDYLFTRKKLLLFYTQTDLIIIMFWLILVNYFFVAYEILFGSLLLLFLSMILIILILSETFKLLTQYKKVKAEVRNYVKQLFIEEPSNKTRLEIINNIDNHNENAHRVNEIDEIAKNVDLILELQVAILKQENEQHLEMLSTIEEFIKKAFRLLMHRDSLNIGMEVAYKVIKYIRRNEINSYIEYEFFYLYFREIRATHYISDQFRLYFFRILEELHKSIINLQTDEIKNKNRLNSELRVLTNVIKTTYLVANRNENLNKEDKEALFRLLHEFVRFKSPKNKKHYYLMFLLKKVILEKDIESFEFFTKNTFIKNTESNKVRLTLNIYLFYLSYKEYEVKKADYHEFYKFNDIFNMDIYLDEPVNNLWDFLYYKELNDWELYPEDGSAKFMIMNGVMQDYLILLELKTNQRLMNLVEDSDIYSFINALSGDRLIDLIEKVTDKFNFRKISVSSIKNKIEQLLYYLKTRYVEKEINRYQNLKLAQANQHIVKNLKEKDFIYELKEDTFIQYFNFNHKIETKSYERIFYDLTTPLMGDEVQSYFYDKIKKEFIDIINIYIIKALNKKVLCSARNRNNKLKLLDSKLNDQHSTILNSLNMGYLKYFEKKYYSKYIDNSKSFYTINSDWYINRLWLNFTAENIDVNLESFSVEVKELDKVKLNSMLREIKVSEKKYEVTLFNDVKIILNREDAIKYLKSKWVKLKLGIDLGVCDKNSIKGQLILFTL